MSPIQHLESRCLLSTTLVNGVLTVNGSAGHDLIELDMIAPTDLKVEVNDVETHFDYTQINKIVVKRSNR